MAQKTFEEALKRLEEIVSKLENGDISLEESINIFKEGVELTKFCKQKLNTAETQLKKLVKDENGNFQLDLI
jgi:exodeoxyribonuclease VII small subunit